MRNDGDSVSLRELAEKKEKEWKEVQNLRVQSLEETLKSKEKQLSNEKLRLRKLKEDFEYNLKLLDDRDQELARYDAVFTDIKALTNGKDSEISELKIKIDELKNKLGEETQIREGLQKHYQMRLKEHHQEFDKYKSTKDAEIKKERKDLETFRREIQQQIRLSEEEIQTQRQELTSGFDDAVRKREHEFRIKTDELNSALLANDLKVKILSKELELVKSCGDKTQADLHCSENTLDELRKSLKEKEWELKDSQNMSNAKVAELESVIEQLRRENQRALDHYQRKHTELDRYARERESAVLTAKESHAEVERSLQDKLRDLQSLVESKDVELRRQTWAHTDALKDRDLTIEKLREEIADTRSTIDSQSSEHARNVVSRDMELETLRQQNDKARAELNERRHDIDRYKKELTLALERESAHERANTQLILDWQRRCEDAEKTGYEKQEDLIKQLTKSRDEDVALSKERERELLQRDDLLRVLTRDRDQALLTLQRHGLSVPVQVPSKEEGRNEDTLESLEGLSDPDKVNKLRNQNKNLRQVIGQMREDMEDLVKQLANSSRPVNGTETQRNNNQDYVKALEEEIQELKSKTRSLETQIQQRHGTATTRPVTIATTSNGIDDPYVRSHIKELNDTIGGLRHEKLEILTKARKDEATVIHLQGVMAQCQEELRQKQLLVEQLKYDLSAGSRRTQDETTAYKQRVSDLELQLAQARKEADEYYKMGLERNLEATSLGNEVSALKLGLASRGKISSGPQSAIVQQLQEEIISLRRQLSSARAPSHHNTSPLKEGMKHSSNNSAVTHLQAQLRLTTQHVTQLAKDKQQLIQMGNRLRAELSRAAGTQSANAPVPPKHLPAPEHRETKLQSNNDVAEQYKTRLDALERLQYELTTQELKIAQRGLEREKQSVIKTNVAMVTSESSSSPGEETVREMKVPKREYESLNPYETSPMSESVERIAHHEITQRTSSPLQNIMTSSSEGHSTLQEVWKLLEDESPRITPRMDVRSNPKTPALQELPTHDHLQEHGSSSDSFTVKGKMTHIEEKVPSQRRQLSQKAAGKYKAAPKTPKIRNYNVKNK